MPIVLTRIDNRLIHGQVAVSWCSHVNANLIVVVDDAVAKDANQQMLLDMAAPHDVGTRYFSTEEAIRKLPKAGPNQRIFLVVREVDVIVKLVLGGIEIKEVNVGNMHFKEGKKQISSAISIDENDVLAFRKLNEAGIKCEAKRVPTENGIDMIKLMKEVE
ncbi:MAG TPA: PTS sugar transporter subunit IIB [Negativicutes bacterium]|nr:PTS sugar transporter subunit IIB [Negativicutes bacterium]